MPLANRIKATGLLLLLLMTPLAGSWLVKESVYPRPHWHHYYDPEMAYYHSGLELLSGEPVSHIHHPGTPVQLLAAAGILIAGDSADAVPAALVVTRWLILLLIPAAMLILLCTVFREVPWYLSVPGIWSFYLSGQSFRYMNLVTAESLYFFVTAVFAASIWVGMKRELDGKGALLVGGALGLCVSTKFLFVAWLPALLVWMFLQAGKHSTGRRLVFLLYGLTGLILGFLLATWFVADRYEGMVTWVTNLGSRDGIYGTGEVSLPDVALVLGNLRQALASAKAWYLWVFFWLVVLSVNIWLARRRNDSRGSQGIAFAVFLVMAILGSHLLLARGFGVRYLMPMAILGLLAFAAAVQWTNLFERRGWQWIPMLLLVPLLAKHMVQDYREHTDLVTTASRQTESIEAMIEEHRQHEESVVVYSFRTPVRSFADRVFAPPWRQSYLDTVYPAEGHYLPWSAELRLPAGGKTWDLIVIREKDVAGLNSSQIREVDRLGDYVVMKNSTTQP